ncbi:MAG: YraN family protein [Eggerthellales bacterium]|nr:YraN family protein [Eggerthellales bacterium]
MDDYINEETNQVQNHGEAAEYSVKTYSEYPNLDLGKKGEEAAVRFLERHGYQIVERNWRCTAGEADIIALDGDVLVFVEVKTRSNIDKGYPEEAVTKEKRERYERISAYYLRDAEYVDMRFRFDIIAILVLGNNKANLRHHINAFGTE